MDTGTITIDGLHEYHDYHTFAIDAGIFVKNSMNEDYFFPVTAEGRGSTVEVLPGGCFAMDTKVSLLDGRELSISEISDEMSENPDKELWTYSCEPLTGKIVPGLISWAGMTQKSAKVMKITLDNGESFICTPEHTFPSYHSEKKRADELKIGDSFISLYRRKKEIYQNKTDYEQLFDNADKEWKYTHRVVAEFNEKSLVDTLVFDESTLYAKFDVVHHCNFDKFNNSPTNLRWMNSTSHIKYHKGVGAARHITLEKHYPNWKTENGFTLKSVLRSLLTQFGYKSWSNFRVKEIPHNHMVVAIDYLAEEISVGTLTIDRDELHHNYHNFALSCGILTQNSNLGEIDDLKYFNNRLARGLRVPSSYLPTGPDDSATPLNDGRVGTAMIQEFRFNQYCERLQNYICLKLDDEFKLFLRWRGLNIDSGLFNIVFNPPQNFAAYRQSEMDTSRVATFASMEAYPYISKRFALSRFLGLSEEEIKENEQLWEEENKENIAQEPKGSDLRSVGISTGNFNTDQETADEIDADPEKSEMPDVAGPVTSPPSNDEVGPTLADNQS
jgi:intein/homing endonuclease